MIIFFKCFRRIDRVYLSIQTVRYIFPKIQIECMLQYKNDINEINKNHIEKIRKLNVNIFFDKKKYDFGQSGESSIVNGFYFTEMINKAHNHYKEYDGKVLVLDEDNIFTKKTTINFLINNEFDLAYGTWGSPDTAHLDSCKKKYGIFKEQGGNITPNASFMCFNFKKLNDFFPLPEKKFWVENLLLEELVAKVKDNYNVKLIPTRNFYDYGGDGIFTNDIRVLKRCVHQANIKFEEL